MTQKFSHDFNPRLQNVEIDEVLQLDLEDSVGARDGLLEQQEQRFDRLKSFVFEIAKRLPPEAQVELVGRNYYSWTPDK